MNPGDPLISWYLAVGKQRWSQTFWRVAGVVAIPSAAVATPGLYWAATESPPQVARILWSVATLMAISLLAASVYVLLGMAGADRMHRMIDQDRHLRGPAREASARIVRARSYVLALQGKPAKALWREFVNAAWEFEQGLAAHDLQRATTGADLAERVGERAAALIALRETTGAVA